MCTRRQSTRNRLGEGSHARENNPPGPRVGATPPQNTSMTRVGAQSRARPISSNPPPNRDNRAPLQNRRGRPPPKRQPRERAGHERGPPRQRSGSRGAAILEHLDLPRTLAPDD